MGEILDIRDAPLAARFESLAADIWSFRPREPEPQPKRFRGGAANLYARALVWGARVFAGGGVGGGTRWARGGWGRLLGPRGAGEKPWLVLAGALTVRKLRQ